MVKKKIDRLQRYAKKVLGASNTIESQYSNSMYFNCNGSIVRISDHMSAANRQDNLKLSLVSTSNPDLYVMEAPEHRKVEVVTYRKAQELLRSISMLSSVFKYPTSPFCLEKEFIISTKAPLVHSVQGLEEKYFTTQEWTKITKLRKQAEERRSGSVGRAHAQDAKEEHLKENK